MKHSPIILGIDPGLQTTGYALIVPGDSGPSIVEAGVIRTTEARDTADMARRLTVLYDGMTEVFTQHKPGAVAIEQLYAHYEHPRTAILMGHARGIFFLCGGQHNVPVVSYAATRVKKTVTGSGRASKEQMQYAIMREFRLSKPPEPHDVADALGIALCHYFLSSTVRRGPNSATFTGINTKAFENDTDTDDENEDHAA